MNARQSAQIYFALRIVAKPFQLEAWSLLTAWNSMPYPTVPSPTPYRHLFSQIKSAPKICMGHYGQAASEQW